MTQAEKGLNKQTLKDFKDQSNSLGPMVPGIFNQSPLRAKDSRAMNTITTTEKPGGHYNIDAPPGHWRP